MDPSTDVYKMRILDSIMEGWLLLFFPIQKISASGHEDFLLTLHVLAGMTEGLIPEYDLCPH